MRVADVVTEPHAPQICRAPVTSSIRSCHTVLLSSLLPRTQRFAKKRSQSKIGESIRGAEDVLSEYFQGTSIGGSFDPCASRSVPQVPPPSAPIDYA